jgi:hypothetical protein
LTDYWTELESEDLMPCGFMEYWLLKSGQVDYKGMKPELSTPKCNFILFPLAMVLIVSYFKKIFVFKL